MSFLGKDHAECLWNYAKSNRVESHNLIHVIRFPSWGSAKASRRGENLPKKCMCSDTILFEKSLISMNIHKIADKKPKDVKSEKLRIKMWFGDKDVSS